MLMVGRDAVVCRPENESPRGNAYDSYIEAACSNRNEEQHAPRDAIVDTRSLSSLQMHDDISFHARH